MAEEWDGTEDASGGALEEFGEPAESTAKVLSPLILS